MKDYKELEKYLQEQVIGKPDEKYRTSGILRNAVCDFIKGETYEGRVGITHIIHERNYMCTYYTDKGEQANLFKIEITRKKGDSHYSSYGISYTDYTIKSVKVVPFYEEKNFEESFERVKINLEAKKSAREQELEIEKDIIKYIRDTHSITGAFSLAQLFERLRKDCYIINND